MSLLHTIENVVKTNVQNQIDLLTSLFGVRCKVYNEATDLYASVYGATQASQKSNAPDFEIELLIVGDTSTPFDFLSVGTLQEGYAFSNDTRLEVGQIIEVLREDKRNRKYKIQSAEAIGTTDVVFFKYKLSAIGE